ncbi:hypothetical protein RB601_002766 [Gaeumannomyces tritici]
MSTEDVEYSFKDVAAHKDGADCWMVIHGQVYDVTKYVQDHPGGADVLIEAAGQDASEAFDSAGHSEDASEIMASFRVGKLKGGASRKPGPKQVRVAVRTPTESPSSGSARGMSLGSKAVVATAAAAGVVAIAQAIRVAPALDEVSIVASLGRSLLPWLAFPSSPSPRQGGGPGFLGGFALASAILTIAGGLAVRKASQIIHFEGGLGRYPPRIKASTAAKPDLLLQRGWLDPTTHHTLPLTAKELLAPGVYRFVFSLPTETTVLGLPIGQHVSIRGVVDGQAVARSYTPTSNNSDRGTLELVVRCYPDGLLTGRYLANLEVGDEVQFRGPKGAMRYRRGLARRVGMLAGGTGITPMYQLIRAICEDPWDTTQVSLVYANRTEADILLRDELEAFARRYPKNLRLHYLLDRPPADWAYGSGYVTRDVLAERMPSPAPDAKVMLCGPPGMVNAAKKLLVELGFEKPGASSKMTDQVFCF